MFTRPFVTILAVQGAYGFAMSAYLLLPKSLAQAGGTPSQIGRVMAAFGVASVLTIPLLERIIGALGRRRVMIAAALIMTASSLGFAAHQGPGGIAVVLRALQGVSWALMFSAAISLASELAPPARLAQAIGATGGASLAMSAVAPAIGEPLVASLGYRALYLMAAFAALVGAALARRLPRQGHARAVPLGTAISHVAAVAPPPTRRLPVYLALGVGGFAYMVLFTFLGPFALQRGIQAIRAFFIAYTIAALGVRVLSGTLFDRLGHRSVGMKALALYGLVVAASGLIGPGWLTALGLAFGVAHGAVIPSLMALLLQGAPHDRRPRILGIANCAMSAGIAAVYPAGGLVDRLGYPAVLVATGVVTAMSALLIRQRR
ncbi:MAG TPA: MFS transporter [Polyangia bacterium]|nr:MFS transporter [Polyangia bacterium]